MPYPRLRLAFVFFVSCCPDFCCPHSYWDEAANCSNTSQHSFARDQTFVASAPTSFRNVSSRLLELAQFLNCVGQRVELALSLQEDALDAFQPRKVAWHAKVNFVHVIRISIQRLQDYGILLGH